MYVNNCIQTFSDENVFFCIFEECKREVITNGERCMFKWKKLEKSCWEDKQNHQSGKGKKSMEQKNWSGHLGSVGTEGRIRSEQETAEIREV